MYEIRFYSKNEDKKINKNIVWHTYSFYDTYAEAYEEFKWLIDFYKEIEINEVTFNPSIPKDKIESYVLFLAKKGKEFATIVST